MARRRQQTSESLGDPITPSGNGLNIKIRGLLTALIAVPTITSTMYSLGWWTPHGDSVDMFVRIAGPFCGVFAFLILHVFLAKEDE